MELGLQVLLLLFMAALIAGWVDVIAGGGGLITIPTLMLCGVAPPVALATNKLQGSAGTLTAAIYFIRRGTVSLGQMKLAMAATFVGSVFGSWLILRLDAGFLLRIIPFLLVAIGLYFLFAPQLDDQERKPRLVAVAFALLICPLIGFYDGFFGPGTGSIMALAFVLCLGYGLSRATAHAKILNFVSNISSLACFALYGEINWVAGGVMIAGQILGAHVAAGMVDRRGATIIRPVVVCVCFLMSVNLLFKSFQAG